MIKNKLQKKRATALTLVLCVFLTAVLSGCGKNAVEETGMNDVPAVETMEQEQPQTAEPETVTELENKETGEEDLAGDRTNGAPWINSNLPGNITADVEIDPREDLSLYANKEWILRNKIPDGHTNWSHYAEVSNVNIQKGIELLSGGALTGHDGELVQGLYNLYLDTDARNELGIAPFKKEADAILAAKTLDDITALSVDDYYKYIACNLISFEVSPGISDSKHYYPFVSADGLILEDSANYTEETEYGNILQESTREIFTYMMERIGMDQAEADSRFDDVLALEAKMAQHILTEEEQLAADYFSRINNVMSLEELTALAGSYPMEQFLKADDFIYNGDYIVPELDYIKSLDTLYVEENVEAIKSRMLVYLAIGRVYMLDEEAMSTVDEIQNNYFGTSGVQPLTEKAYLKVRDMLGEPLSREFIKKYSSEEDRKRVEDVCYEVIDTYREILSANDWASKETIDYAIKKLDGITVNAGWPDKWEDYAGLSIDGLSYYEAIDAINVHYNALSVSKLGKEPDPAMWASDFGSVLECNAFYDFQNNSINMILGMMGEPFYYSDMSVEELYASLGAFWIGHEVSHAFDSNGAQFDIDGNLEDWWTDEDYAEFTRRVEKMDKYLDGIRIMGDYFVTGSNVDSEMIADMTGLQCALKMAEKVENFDYKKFFEYFCQMNASLIVYELQLSILQGDPHPLDYLRGNVPVQQFEEFYETYDVKEGDKMYLAPEDRLVIW